MKLIDDWAIVAWHSATTRTTALVNSIVAIIGLHYAALLGILPFLPVYLRLPLAIVIGAAVTIPTIIARISQQPKMQAKCEAKKGA